MGGGRHDRLKEALGIVGPSGAGKTTLAHLLVGSLAPARRAGAHEMILALSGGYDPPIGEGGVALSGGQRQCIALARAVFGEPALVEAVVRMRKEGVLGQVDKVLALQAGTVGAFGPREEVLAALRGAATAAGPEARLPRRSSR